MLSEATETEGLLVEGELILKVSGVKQFIKTVTEEFPIARGAEDSDRTGVKGFNSFSTWDECIDVFLNKPQSLVKYSPARIPSRASELGSELSYDVEGDFIDIGRYVEGVPEVFGSLRGGVGRNRRVRILVDIGNSAGLSEGSIRYRGERIIRLIDALESMGVRCELVVIDSGKTAHIECVVKEYESPLILEDLAVATHPEFSRRLCFRVAEYSKTYDEGYGDSDHLKDRACGFASKYTEELTIFIHSNLTTGVDNSFNKLERALVSELANPIPSLSMVQVFNNKITEAHL